MSKKIDLDVDLIKRKYELGYQSMESIAREMNVSPATIRHRLVQANAKLRGHSRNTHVNQSDIERLFHVDRLSIADIGRHFRVSGGFISARLVGQSRRPLLRYEDIEDDTIVAEYNAGSTADEIAKRYNVALGTINGRLRSNGQTVRKKERYPARVPLKIAYESWRDEDYDFALRLLKSGCFKQGNGDCWIAPDHTLHDTKGYGVFTIEGKGHLVHRMAMAMHLRVQGLPRKVQVHHKCATKACCNPDHLALATAQENMAEMQMRHSLYEMNRLLRDRLSEVSPDDPIIQVAKMFDAFGDVALGRK